MNRTTHISGLFQLILLALGLNLRMSLFSFDERIAGNQEKSGRHNERNNPDQKGTYPGLMCDSWFLWSMAPHVPLSVPDQKPIFAKGRWKMFVCCRSMCGGHRWTHKSTFLPVRSFSVARFCEDPLTLGASRFGDTINTASRMNSLGEGMLTFFPA